MPRLLVMSTRTITVAARAEYLETLAVRRVHATAASVNFWVFEKRDAPGNFMEFLEAGQPDALQAAILAFAVLDSMYASENAVWEEVSSI